MRSTVRLVPRGAAGTRAPVHTPGLYSATPRTPISRPYAQPASLLAMLIEVDEDLIGVVVLVRRGSRSRSRGDVALSQTFVDQAAIPLANVRLHRRRRPVRDRVVAVRLAAGCAAHLQQGGASGRRLDIALTPFRARPPPPRLRRCSSRLQRRRSPSSCCAYPMAHLESRHRALRRDARASSAGDGLLVFFQRPLLVDDHEASGRFGLRFAAQERFGSSGGGHGGSEDPSSVSETALRRGT